MAMAMILEDPRMICWVELEECENLENFWYCSENFKTYVTEDICFYDALEFFMPLKGAYPSSHKIAIAEENYHNNIYFLYWDSIKQCWSSQRKRLLELCDAYEGQLPIDIPFRSIETTDEDIVCPQVYDKKTYDGGKIMRITKSILGG